MDSSTQTWYRRTTNHRFSWSCQKQPLVNSISIPLNDLQICIIYSGKYTTNLYLEPLMWEGACLSAIHGVLTPAEVISLFIPLQNLPRILESSINTTRLKSLNWPHIKFPAIGKRRIELLELYSNIVKTQLTQRRIIVNITAIAVWTIATDQWMEIIEPIALIERDLLYLFFENIKFVEY